ncbi:MAG: HAD family hydrolase [Clostridia bacterium]|nr:HAD family hydrolase [Clostridia bacterium]
MIRAVVFDLDDTLVDSWSRFDGGMLPVLEAAGIAYDREEMIAKMHPQGVPPTAALFCRMGVSGTVEEVTRRLEEGMYREYAYRIRLMPDAETYLRRLRADGVRLFVLTASPHSITDPCLRNNAVYDWFERVWTVEDYGMGKSDPQLFEKVVEDIGLPAEEILYFDDNPVAVVNAADAGMQTCGVLCPHTPQNAAKIPTVTQRYISSFSEML